MNKLSKKLMLTLITVSMLLCMATSVLADAESDAVSAFIVSSSVVGTGGVVRFTDGVVQACCSTAQTTTNTTAVTLSDNKTIVYYNPSSISTLYAEQQKAVASSQVNQKVNDLTTNLSITANTGAASTMLSGFKPILELALGIIVVIITFGMTLFSSFDVCYIAFPVFRNKAEEAKESGNGMMAKKSANGEVSLRWITDDAQYAVTQGTIDSGKSPWSLYFKKRIASYIFLGIILFILLTGNISIITSLAVNVVSGIINIISGLAAPA